MTAQPTRKELEEYARLLEELKCRQERAKQIAPGGLLEFVRYFWRVLEPQIPLVEGWALEAICEHLEAVSRGKITRLLINVPPGFMKSMLTDVFWPAYEWACLDKAHYRYVTFSYSATLTERDNGRFRDLLCSPEFQRLWGHKFEVTTIGVTRVANNKTGWKLASSVGGVGTGERGDRVIADDLHNVKEAESEIVRTETVRWFQEAAENRLNDLKTGAIIVIMQRVHEMDVSGAIMRDGNYVHLLIPMEFEPGRAKTTSIGWSDPRKKDGELAWPERFDEQVLAQFRKRPYMWAGQYQQRPEPRGGAIFKRDWWQNWNDETAKQFGVKPGFLPSFSYVLGILDTAYTAKEDRDPSAMTVLGLFHDAQGNPNVLLVNAFEEWLEFPDLAPRVIKLAQATRIDRLLIEAKSAGLSIAQELQRQSGHLGFAIETVDPGKSDKVARAHAQTYAFEEGIVWAPGYEDGTFRKFATKVINQMAMFPRAEHDDLTDTVVMGLRYLRDYGLLVRREEHSRSISERMQFRGRQKKLYDV